MITKDISIKQPKQYRSKLKFESILAASARVLADKGFVKTTTAEIALEAEVGIGSVYDYFSNKEAILIAYIDDQLGQALNKANHLSLNKHLDGEAMLRDFLTVGIDFAIAQKEVLQTLFLHMPQYVENIELTKSQALIQQIAQQFAARQLGSQDINPRDLELTLYGITNTVIGFQFRIAVIQDNPFEAEELVEQLYNMIAPQILPSGRINSQQSNLLYTN